jgi:hypothetical protein
LFQATNQKSWGWGVLGSGPCLETPYHLNSRCWILWFIAVLCLKDLYVHPVLNFGDKQLLRWPQAILLRL